MVKQPTHNRSSLGSIPSRRTILILNTIMENTSHTTRRILSWNPHQLPQSHTTTRPVLVVSGCSFTDLARDNTVPLTWPGYLAERCRFDHVIDLSHTGAGNEYISTSIINEIESMTLQQRNECLVIVCWSGIDRHEILEYTDAPTAIPYKAIINNIFYKRKYNLPKVYKVMSENESRGEALRSWKNILMLQNYLENKNISFGFSFYVNVFDPPFLPRRDSGAEWPDRLDKKKIEQLRQCHWIHPHVDSLFEWCFFHDELDHDLFHPSANGSLKWVDAVLLPGLVNMGVIDKIN